MRIRMPIKIAFSVVICVLAVVSVVLSQTSSRPEILGITFPATIQADDEEYKGRILFKDVDGDATRAELTILEAEDPQAITIDGQTPQDNVISLPIKSPAEKQKAGKGLVLLKIATTTSQQVKIRVVLTDEAGNESDPEEFSFTARGNIPDLVVSLGTLPPDVHVGQEIDVSYTIQNIGGGDSGSFRIGAYLSRDGAVTTDDLLLRSQEISGLASDAAASQRLKLKITQELMSQEGLEPGSLFLGVIADDLNQVAESDETNNVGSSPIQVKPRPKQPAFFEIVDLSVEPSSPVAGSTTTIKATIENTGEEGRPDRVSLYIEGAFKTSQTLSLGSKSKSSVSFVYTFSAAGSYRVEIRTSNDSQGVTVEVKPAFPETGTLLYQDDFSNPNSGWSVWSETDERSAYEDGEYSIIIREENWMAWSWCPEGKVFRDFIVEVETRRHAGIGGSYGVVWGKDDGNFYSFEVNGGSFVVAKQLNDEWVDDNPVPWTPSSAIKTGNVTNHLKLIVNGNQVMLYVNDVFLEAVTSSSFGLVEIGLTASAYEVPPVEIRFNNMKIYEVED